ncbi:MAG: ComF family protein [Actinophytocola sp.]|nr:ComF family protein [Actinophytocola sp.]
MPFLLDQALDLLLPPVCVGCGASGAACCPGCLNLLASPSPLRCPSMAPAYALAGYRGVPRTLVLAYKERGRRDLAPVLGGLLAAALPLLPLVSGDAAACCLVPAPSRRATARMRGGQHMLRLARHCASRAAERGIRVSIAPALRLASDAKDAVGLDPATRAANLAGRVLPVPAALPPAGTGVVLLDDVVTTGATAVACERALASVGVPVTAVLALTAPQLP